MTTTQTAPAAALAATATGAGWIVTTEIEGFTFTRPTGRRYITVRLTVRGAFLEAATATRRISSRAALLAALAA